MAVYITLELEDMTIEEFREKVFDSDKVVEVDGVYHRVITCLGSYSGDVKFISPLLNHYINSNNTLHVSDVYKLIERRMQENAGLGED